MVFKRIGGAIKSFAKKAASTVKRGVQAAVPAIVSVGRAGLGVLSKVPGTIGSTARAINTGLDVAKKVINKIPNEKVRDKLNNFVSGAGSKTNNVLDKVSSAAKTGIDMANTINSAVSKS
jgi:hypothetical protein